MSEFAARVKAPAVVLHIGSIEMKNYTDKLLEMLARGEKPPNEFSRDEVAEILIDSMKEESATDG